MSEVTQVQEDKHLVFSPMKTLTLNFQICVFNLENTEMSKWE